MEGSQLVLKTILLYAGTLESQKRCLIPVKNILLTDFVFPRIWAKTFGEILNYSRIFCCAFPTSRLTALAASCLSVIDHSYSFAATK